MIKKSKRARKLEIQRKKKQKAKSKLKDIKKQRIRRGGALWARKIKNTDACSACSACSAMLASHCLLRLRAPLRSFVCSLAHLLTPELMRKSMIRCLKTTWFCPTVGEGGVKWEIKGQRVRPRSGKICDG